MTILHRPHIILHARQGQSTAQAFSHECPKLWEMNNRTDGVCSTVKLRLEIPSFEHHRVRLCFVVRGPPVVFPYCRMNGKSDAISCALQLWWAHAYIHGMGKRCRALARSPR